MIASTLSSDKAEGGNSRLTLKETLQLAGWLAAGAVFLGTFLWYLSRPAQVHSSPIEFRNIEAKLLEINTTQLSDSGGSFHVVDVSTTPYQSGRLIKLVLEDTHHNRGVMLYWSGDAEYDGHLEMLLKGDQVRLEESLRYPSYYHVTRVRAKQAAEVESSPTRP
jgi:hypothetical protein